MHMLAPLLQGSDYKGFRAKISDFGLSQHMTKDQNYVVVSKGTEAYLPLEVFQNFALTEKSDVYAMGLLMWEIFYGIFWHAIYEEEKKRKGCAPAPALYACKGILRLSSVSPLFSKQLVYCLLACA